MTKQNLKIEYRRPEELVAYPGNAKKHSAYQIAQIRRSIEEFGFNNPVLLDGDEIIAGHGRIFAALQLDMEVPTIQLKHLSETGVKAYRIADNRIAENGEWDQMLLAFELEDIKEDVDWCLTGFEPKELAAIFEDVAADEPMVPREEFDKCPTCGHKIKNKKEG